MAEEIEHGRGRQPECGSRPALMTAIEEGCFKALATRCSKMGAHRFGPRRPSQR